MDEKGLTESQLLPVLQFNEKLLDLIQNYKRKFELKISYNSDEWLVSYKFNIGLELGKYEATLEFYYDEVKAEEINDWADLILQVNHIESIMEA